MVPNLLRPIGDQGRDGTSLRLIEDLEPRDPVPNRGDSRGKRPNGLHEIAGTRARGCTQLALTRLTGRAGPRRVESIRRGR